MDDQEKTSVSIDQTLPDYEKYEERLRSFNEKPWPTDSVIYIKDLVEAGFVYTGERDLVFCFKCGVMESNWDDHEIPRDRHFLSNKCCPFLAKFNREVDMDNSKSIKSIEDFEREDLLYDWIPGRGLVQRRPEISSSSVPTSESSGSVVKPVDNLAGKIENVCINLRLANEKMRYEQKRFQSFGLCETYNKHWPSAERLASAGFYFVDKKVGMKCFCCDVIVASWECAEQCPMTKHRALYSKCRFVIGSFCGNIPVGQESVHVGVPIAQQKPIKPPKTTSYAPSRTQYEISKSNGNGYHHDFEYKRQLVEDIIPNRYDSFDDGPSFLISVPPVRHELVIKQSSNFYQPKTHLPQYQNSMYSHQPATNLNHHSPTYKITPTMSPSPSPPQNEPPYSSNGLSKYFQESQRLKTFFTWPKETLISAITLAKAGFFYTNKNDIVQCCMCSLIVGDWKPGDDPNQIHFNRRANCPFLMNNNTAAHTQHHPTAPNMYNRLHQRGPTHQNPNHPHLRHSNHHNRYQHPHFAINAPRVKHLPLNEGASQGFMNPNHHHQRQTNPPQSPTCNTQQYQMSYQTSPRQHSPGFSCQESHRRQLNMVPPSVKNHQSQQKVIDPTPGGHEMRLPLNTEEILQIHKANQERARIAYEEEQKEKHSSNRNLCKICQDNPVTITLVPCGHLVLCESCALGLLMCPVCRNEITKTIRTFFDGN